MQRRLQAGAQCEDLRFYTPHFYRVGAALCTLGLEERMAEVLMGTWRVRYKQLLVPSLRGDSRHDSVELMSKLTLEEQQLFEAGHGGVLAFERYRATRPLMQRYDGFLGITTHNFCYSTPILYAPPRSAALKRKWSQQEAGGKENMVG